MPLFFNRRSVRKNCLTPWENGWQFQPSKKYKEHYDNAILAIERAQELEREQSAASAQVEALPIASPVTSAVAAAVTSPTMAASPVTVIIHTLPDAPPSTSISDDSARYVSVRGGQL